MNIEFLHGRLGHVSETVTQKTAGYYGVNLTGTLPPCKDCALAKAKQKTVSKITPKTTAKIKGERLYMEISSICSISYGGAKFWLLIVDEATDYCWRYFIKTKDEVIEHLMGLL